jgi:hypothetical protein
MQRPWHESVDDSGRFPLEYISSKRGTLVPYGPCHGKAPVGCLTPVHDPLDADPFPPPESEASVACGPPDGHTMLFRWLGDGVGQRGSL